MFVGQERSRMLEENGLIVVLGMKQILFVVGANLSTVLVAHYLYLLFVKNIVMPGTVQQRQVRETFLGSKLVIRQLPTCRQLAPVQILNAHPHPHGFRQGQHLDLFALLSHGFNKARAKLMNVEKLAALLLLQQKRKKPIGILLQMRRRHHAQIPRAVIRRGVFLVHFLVQRGSVFVGNALEQINNFVVKDFQRHFVVARRENVLPRLVLNVRENALRFGCGLAHVFHERVQKGAKVAISVAADGANRGVVLLQGCEALTEIVAAGAAGVVVLRLQAANGLPLGREGLLFDFVFNLFQSRFVLAVEGRGVLRGG